MRSQPTSNAARALVLAGLIGLLPLLPATAQETAPATTAAQDSAEAATNASPVGQGEWKTSSSIIEPSRYPADFAHYDYVNPQAPKGGDLNKAAPGTFDSFNPFVVRGTPAAGFVAFGGGLAYDTLMEQSLDEPGVSHGLIAEAIRFPPDYSSVSFRLDPAAKWHDGLAITPEDVVWSFETLTELYPLWGNYYRNVTKAEKTGEREVTFRFDQANNRELPNIMGDLTVLPKHWWEGTDASGKTRDIGQPTLEVPLGSGAYKVESFQPGSAITWARVEDYWAKDHPLRVGRNNFDRLRYTYFRDETASWEAFKKGGIDDYRAENRAQRWAEGYNFPAVESGNVVKSTFTTQGAEAFQGYVMNTRRDKFKDRRVRQALTLAFNFAEMNRTLFYGLYERTTSYFENTELAATGLPSPAELALLEPLRGQLPEEVFTAAFALPDYTQPNAERAYLREAFELLTAAGFERRGADLVNSGTGEPLTIEFLGADPSSTRIFEPFANQLRRLGIRVNIRIVDASQYLALTNDFEFDVITDSFAQSLSPGNEQRDFWSSAAAAQPGSRNSAGVADPAIDALIEKVIFAKDRDSLVTATRALDRVLQWSYYAVPQWHLKGGWLAYWNKFGMPARQPAYAGLDPFSWWVKADASTATPASATQPSPAVPQAQ
ncbi:MAG: ABC transporter substrate-binding protein [Rhizobiaceae bacterium]|nr:ABC transporter substrate-binding protein [Rhizobiaceae bacterium]